MISDPRSAAGRRFGIVRPVRNRLLGSWLVFLVLLLASTLLLRAIRMPWLGAVVIIAFALFWLAWNVAAARRSAPAPWLRTTKNVTPDEPRLPAGHGGAPAEGRSGPEVIVVEAEPPVGELEAKLQALERLRVNGLLTDAEYEAKRAQVIAEF